jgi:hypothetical protein
MVIEGAAAGQVITRTAQITGKIAPVVNTFAENTLAKTSQISRVGLNKVSQGLGTQADILFARDAAKASKLLDRADLALNNVVRAKVVSPIQNTVFKVKNEAVTVAQRTASIMPKSNSELAMFSRTIVKPNLGEYSTNAVNKFIEPLQTKGKQLAQPFIDAKAVGKQVLNAEPIRYTTTKPFINNPIRNVKAEFNQVLKAESLSRPVQAELKTAKKGQIIKIGLDADPEVFVKTDAYDFSKMAKQVNNQLRNPITTTQKAASKQTSILEEVATPKIKTQFSGFTGKTASINGIFGISKTALAPYPGTQKQRNRENLEIISYPTSISDLKINQPTSLNQDTTLGNTSIFNSIFDSSNLPLINKPGESNIPEVKIDNFIDTTITPIIKDDQQTPLMPQYDYKQEIDNVIIPQLISSQPKREYPFNNGLKIKESGYSLPSSKRKSGLDSELKVYGIATAQDFAAGILGLKRKRKR